MLSLGNNKKGFTIIEVLIVLAIAGVIILIVLLAVPALQRNSRNTQRKNDISAIVGAFSEYITSNNGNLPTTVATGIAGARLAFYTAADVTGSTVRTVAVASVTSNASGVIINNFTKCPATLPAAGTAAVTMNNAGASKRSITAVYRIETTSNFQVQCTDF